jgi:carboxylesterase type B
LSKQVAALPYPDYRLVLSAIIGDYLFRCPNQLFARVLSDIQPQVYLYEFSLPTKTPGFSCCDGLACHTAELPYPFNLYDVIEKIYSNENNKSLEESCELPQDDDLLTHNIIVDVTSGESRVGRRSLLSNRQVVDKRVANLMAEYWSNFAKYGDPNGYSSQNGLK